MKGTHRRANQGNQGEGAISLMEEAFHLVRSSWADLAWRYYLGSIPWMLGFLYFVADMSRSSLAIRDAALASLGMGLLWAWKLRWQARYCEGLWRRLEGEGDARQSGSGQRRGASLAALWLMHAFRLPVLLISIVTVAPLGWVIAAWENAVVLTFTVDLGGRPLHSLASRSLRLSHFHWGRNHSILLIFLVAALVTWLNIVVTFLVLPNIADSVFGIESLFSTNPEAALGNTTFLLGTFLLVQLVLGPFFHGVYVLRCFSAESRSTGADLLGRLRRFRQERKQAEANLMAPDRIAIALILVLGGLFLISGVGQTAETSLTPESTRFQEEITKVLEQKRYQWRLPRRVLAPEIQAEHGWLVQQVKEIARGTRRMAKTVWEWIDKTILKRMNERGKRTPKTDIDPSQWSRGVSSVISIILLLLLIALVSWLIAVYLRHQKGKKALAVGVTSQGGDIRTVNLASDDLLASQFAEDEWLSLAREQIARGEQRLAVRALFLATLAHLGERGMLRIERSRSNGDYRKDLRIRARTMSDLLRAFDENTLLFERVWYGMHKVGASSIETYLANHGRIVATAALAPSVRPREEISR